MRVLILILVACSTLSAQAIGSCWEVKSDLKKTKRYACSGINDSPFVVRITQHHIFHQLRQVRPLHYDLVLERGSDHNRKHGNSRMERIERNGLPLAGALGAFGVFGGGPITAGLSAAAPILVPAIRKWFSDASKPLWEVAPQLLSDTQIVLEPGTAAGFWFYAEKGGMDGEFKILPPEMVAVEEHLAQHTVSFQAPPAERVSSWSDYGFTVVDLPTYTEAKHAARRMNLAESERNLPQHEAQSASQNLANEYYLRTIPASR